MIKLREKGISKAETETGQILGQVSQVVNAKKKLLKKIKNATPLNT